MVTTRSQTGSLPTPKKRFGDDTDVTPGKARGMGGGKPQTALQFRINKMLHEMWFFVVLLAPFSYVYHYHGHELWGRVAASTTPFTRGVVIPFVLSNAIFWSLSLFLSYVDLGRPAFLTRYKVQETKFITRAEWWKAVRVAFRNQLLIGLPFGFLSYYAATWRGCSVGTDLPPLSTVWRDLFAYLIVEEIMFYYSHRGLHYGWFYKHIHKIHHEFKYPVGLAAIYAHPIEMVLSNLLPLWMGPFLLGSHVIQLQLWYSIALISTINSHSGYWFPGMPSPLAHDYHHSHFVYNYGVLGVLDKIHETDGKFMSYVAQWTAHQDDLKAARSQ